MENESDSERRFLAKAIFVLSGFTLFAGVGPASAEINGSIGIVASLLSFYIGYAQARKDDPAGFPSFVVSAAGMYVAFSQMLGR